MAELQTFFNMGGYAVYVWPSFLISFVVLLANVMFAKSQYKRVLKDTAMRARTRSKKSSDKNP